MQSSLYSCLLVYISSIVFLASPFITLYFCVFCINFATIFPLLFISSHSVHPVVTCTATHRNCAHTGLLMWGFFLKLKKTWWHFVPLSLLLFPHLLQHGIKGVEHLSLSSLCHLGKWCDGQKALISEREKQPLGLCEAFEYFGGISNSSDFTLLWKKSIRHPTENCPKMFLKWRIAIRWSKWLRFFLKKLPLTHAQKWPSEASPFFDPSAKS